MRILIEVFVISDPFCGSPHVQGCHKLDVFHFSTLFSDIPPGFSVTVQNGGKTGEKSCVKLTYKQLFPPVFTSEEPPMLLE